MKFLLVPRSFLGLALAGALSATAAVAAAQVTGPTGGGQPIGNSQPSLVLTQLVPLQGIFPCRDCAGANATHNLGSVRTFAGDFPLGGSATANGQTLTISQNTALFSLLGTTYGGNGQSNFSLPDLGGRAVIGAGAGPGLTLHDLGEQSGVASNTLTIGNLPAHDHDIPGGTTGLTGAGQPFDNGQPSLALNYQIAATGLFPSGSADPFVGQIGMFAGNFESGGWLQADGRLVSINDYEALFYLIGTTYGGDGQTNFALPNLVGRLAVGAGGASTLGETFGQESTFLTDATMPAHDHDIPGGGFTALEGGGQPYDNAQPSLAINYLINVQGIFPSREGATLDLGLPFLGEIVGYAGDYLPPGWAFAQGQILNISQNQALFSILGTTYGGDGRTTFALPDLRDRTIVGSNGLFPVGQQFGNRFNTLNVAQLAPHDHTLPLADVPEPAEWLLLLGGFAMVGAALRRRRAAVTLTRIAFPVG